MDTSYGGLWSLSQRANHLVMILVPNQNDSVILTGKLNRFQMDLGHQGAGGVDYFETTAFCLFPNRRRDSVGAENDPRSAWHLFQLFHKHCSGRS